jgi:CRISPR/Cas system-associated endoribonuclease Cas2
MSDPVKLFLKIAELVSDGKIRLKPSSKIGELFQDPAIFGPLEYELCIYSLEATLGRQIDESFYEGDATKDLNAAISDFITQYLHDEVSSDPLFIARQFKKFAKSARWEGDEKAEPGKN